MFLELPTGQIPVEISYSVSKKKVTAGLKYSYFWEDIRTVFVSYFFVIVTVIVTVIVPYAMFILLL